MMHTKFLEIVLQHPTHNYAEALEMLRFAFPPTPPPSDDDPDALLEAVAQIEQAHRPGR